MDCSFQEAAKCMCYCVDWQRPEEAGFIFGTRSLTFNRSEIEEYFYFILFYFHILLFVLFKFY